jgi:MYXO-CTERM domain-containing protein
MYQKLFNITLILVLAIVSIAFFAFLLTGVMSMFQTPVVAGHYGITFSVGGVSARWFTYLLMAAVLLIGGILLWRRRRRFHR